MKAYVENIFARLGIAGDIVATQTSDEIYSVALTYSNRGGKILGKMGLVSHKILKRFDIDVEVSFCRVELGFANENGCETCGIVQRIA